MEGRYVGGQVSEGLPQAPKMELDKDGPQRRASHPTAQGRGTEPWAAASHSPGDPSWSRLSMGRPEAWGPRGSCRPQESRGLGWDQPMEEAAGCPGSFRKAATPAGCWASSQDGPARPEGVPPLWQLPRPGLPEFPRSVNCVLQIKIATSMR